MKALRQLVREFWLPLLLGIAWTAFNVLEKPRSQWNVRQVLNILGPTFFLMSWLVAQWYRVRKQQRDEDGLDQISAGVRALQEPLLPCAVFATFKVPSTAEDLARIFKGQPGYRSYGANAETPSGAIHLPPGFQDGRMMLRDGYLDYRNGVAEAAGVFLLSPPGYNTIHCPITHTYSRVRPGDESSPTLSNDPLFAPSFVQIEIYPAGRPSSIDTTPSIVLKSGMDGAKIIAAHALDETVFVDVRVGPLSPARGGASGWSSHNLRGAFLRATLDFVYLEGMHQCPPPERWPTLHNFQLWLGGQGRQLFTFTVEQLSAQVSRTSPTPVFAHGAGCSQILFEYQIDQEAFSKGLLSVS